MFFKKNTFRILNCQMTNNDHLKKWRVDRMNRWYGLIRLSKGGSLSCAQLLFLGEQGSCLRPWLLFVHLQCIYCANTLTFRRPVTTHNNSWVFFAAIYQKCLTFAEFMRQMAVVLEEYRSSSNENSEVLQPNSNN